MLQKYFFNYVLRNLSVLKITVLIVEPKNSTATTQTMQQLNQNLTLNMKLVTCVKNAREPRQVKIGFGFTPDWLSKQKTNIQKKNN